MKKTKQEILSDLLDRMEKQTEITNTDPGSVARTFVEILTEEFYEFYNELELASTMSFVSTASGRYLDMIGRLLDCQRENGEGDENYRSRIINQVYVVAGANYTSIRLKALSVQGVKDVVFREYTHGAGSFTIHVITDEAETPVSVLNEVESVVNKTKAYGVYAEVKTPVLIPLGLMVRLVFSKNTGNAEKMTIRQNVSRSVKDYIDSLSLGDTMVINEVIERIMHSDEKIEDLEIYSLKVNGVGQFVNNIDTNWDERLVLDALKIV